MKFSLRKKHKGFSLVELLVVIAIMAVLSVTAYTAFGGQTVKARNAKRVQDLDIIQSALEVHYVNNGSYPAPDTTDGLTFLDRDAITLKELSTIPKDPRTEGDYYYATFNSGQEFILGASLEADDTDPAVPYVVGNHDATAGPDADDGWNSITGAGGPGEGNQCLVAVDGTTCFPYQVQ